MRAGAALSLVTALAGVLALPEVRELVPHVLALVPATWAPWLIAGAAAVNLFLKPLLRGEAER